jgi:threonine/homoserine/homoserine lactone efflux protein
MSSLTFSSIAALFAAMVLLAAVPSVSVLAVSARSASAGFVHGAFMALGIVAGDVVFILLAIFGLVLLVETLGSMFFLVAYLGGAYLIWLGLSLWKSPSRPLERTRIAPASLLSSFMSGFLITLGDQKAVFFYLGFLPAFLDLNALTWLDVGTIVVVATVAVGGVKLGYAYVACRAGVTLGAGAAEAMNVAAACVLVAAGVLVIVRA